MRTRSQNRNAYNVQQPGRSVVLPGRHTHTMQDTFAQTCYDNWYAIAYPLTVSLCHDYLLISFFIIFSRAFATWSVLICYLFVFTSLLTLCSLQLAYVSTNRAAVSRRPHHRNMRLRKKGSAWRRYGNSWNWAANTSNTHRCDVITAPRMRDGTFYIAI